MTKLRIMLIAGVIISMFPATTTLGQKTQTMGVFINDTANTYHGYTLFAPKQNTMTYLIDNEGHKIHEWTASTYPPGQSVYLLPNGHLLRTCMTQGNLGTGGGEGGRIEEYTWGDTLVWSMDYSTSTYMQHHDIKKLPNGNIIMLVVEKKTLTEIINAGFDTSQIQDPDFAQKHILLPDAVVEIQPTYPTGGTVVWRWSVWDHLIQDFDAGKLNYGVVNQHPELVDCDGDHRRLPLFWNHMNAIDYNATFDQIVMSVRGNSELWVIDHSTTMAQAAGHTGGNSNKGGDLIYRWGNPLCYGRGNMSNQKYFEQHDVEWIPAGCPGAGNLLCFNNGVNRNYSSVDEITPPVDAFGNYTIVGSSAYGPTNFTWTYNMVSPDTVYAHDISGAQRQPNGNTLMCAGPFGALYEVTAAGSIVWKYISPVTDTGPLHQGDSIPHNPVRPEETMNSIFRVYRYAPTYSAFIGHDMTPGDFIEIYPTSAIEYQKQNSVVAVYPNPFTGSIGISNASGDENYILMNAMGQTIWMGTHIEKQDFSALSRGLYILKVNEQNSVQTIKLMKQ
jgi:hypothetical protein